MEVFVSLRARNLAIMLLLLFVSATSCAAAPYGLGEYRLEIGDRIQVYVFGEKELSELSDEFLIDGTGNIRMPLLGPIHVVGKTLGEARTLIFERLEGDFLKEPLVTVAIIELKPIFVLGDVRTPGQHPFKFGLTVLNAVAMAGGFGSERLRQGDARGDLIAAEERLRLASHRYARLRVRIARIEAEQTDQEHFDAPDLSQKMSHVNTTELVEQELERLNSSLRSHKRLIKLYRDQTPTIAREIEARNEEIVALKGLIEIYEDQLKRISKFKLAPRIIELRTKIVQSQSLLSRVRGEVATLEEKLVAVDIKAEEAIAKREERILSELADARQQLGEIEASLPSVIETIELRRREAGQIIETNDWQQNYEIRLKRGFTDELQKVSDAGRIGIGPGDTIFVHMVRPPDAGRRSTDFSRLGYSDTPTRQLGQRHGRSLTLFENQTRPSP